MPTPMDFHAAQSVRCDAMLCHAMQWEVMREVQLLPWKIASILSLLFIGSDFGQHSFLFRRHAGGSMFHSN